MAGVAVPLRQSRRLSRRCRTSFPGIQAGFERGLVSWPVADTREHLYNPDSNIPRKTPANGSRKVWATSRFLFAAVFYAAKLTVVARDSIRALEAWLTSSLG